MNPLVQIAIDELPTIIGYLKVLFAKDNPDDPQPTDQDIMDAYHAALTNSLATDADWLSRHPQP